MLHQAWNPQTKEVGAASLALFVIFPSAYLKIIWMQEIIISKQLATREPDLLIKAMAFLH